MTSPVAQAAKLLSSFLQKNGAANEQAWMISMRKPNFLKLKFHVDGQYLWRYSFPQKKLGELRREVTRISGLTRTSVTFQRAMHQLANQPRL